MQRGMKDAIKLSVCPQEEKRTPVFRISAGPKYPHQKFGSNVDSSLFFFTEKLILIQIVVFVK